MLRLTRSEPDKEDWYGSALWKAGNNTQNILIPLEVDHSNFITGYVVLDESGFPEDGQSILFDYAGSSFRESRASLTIHRELGDPSLEDGYTITLLKLAYSIDHCNALSQNHAIKTAFWARNIALGLGYTKEKLGQIELASKLHDIGKVLVPKSVLTRPRQLSAQEWRLMRRHPTFGAMIMKPSSRLHPLIPYVEAHHEYFDGSGYPFGLVGEQIPIQARILSVADAYATMTEGRVYQSASTNLQALRELIRCCGRQFDPEIIAVMIDIITSGEVDDSHCVWELV
jgi:HD-GYP domain-containing protein (c-di-GMP phosphodiesterase class II)